MTSLLMMSDGWGLFCLLVLGLFLMLAVGFLWGDFCRRMRRHRLDVLSQRHPISWQILPLDSPEALRGLRIFNGFHKTLEAASEHLANNNRDAAKGIMDQYMTPMESKAFLRECEQRVYESRRELDMKLDLVRCREVKLEGQRTIFELTTRQNGHEQRPDGKPSAVSDERVDTFVWDETHEKMLRIWRGGATGQELEIWISQFVYPYGKYWQRMRNAALAVAVLLIVAAFVVG
ncbi:MAG: hypothetical protein HUJ64_08185, partial [Limosilactobacillus mucosae]|nr:hypothetical protein [Limosilactobacillus mucosae]